MALSPQFLDELKHRFTLSDVIGREVKLVRRGREHTGLCPFHNEKTPSFTVNDQKGFYHCFGCGAHGSVLDYIMHARGMEFMEAVTELAGEAGMEVPKPSREQVERDKRRASLSEVMEMVTNWYAEQLHRARGKAAYEYVTGRGLSQHTIDRYRLGYAPGGRSDLKEAMLARGVLEEQLVETGMLIKPDDGGASYDRFRDRLMFPIADRQGRIIAFGGRALSATAKAKYLNSPETTLFHKGATLYNWATARKASYDVGQVMVVEGYMDVIALGQAGIDHTVAPLGTALTEEQIAHLWHMADEPILSFDGDNAGRRAAMRAMDRALPMLRPGKSLRFVFMPDGDDPDTLVMREGKGAIDALSDTAEPLVNMLWKNLTEGEPADTPERRAGFEKKVFLRLADIQDENVKKLYQSEFRSRIYQLFRPAQGATRRVSGFQARGKSRYTEQSGPSRLIAATSIGRSKGTGPVMDHLEKLLMLTLVNHPEIAINHAEDIAGLDLGDGGFAAIRDVILSVLSAATALDRDTVHTHLVEKGLTNSLSKLETSLSSRSDWFAFPEAALGDAITGFEHALRRYQYITGVYQDYKAAEADYANEMTEENQTRFFAAQEAYRALEEKDATITNFGLESGRASVD